MHTAVPIPAEETENRIATGARAVPFPRGGARRLQAPGRFYSFMRVLWRFVFQCTMRVKSARLEALSSEGGCLIAVCHVSHLDPVFVSVCAPRRISWMAREEFYANPVCARYLDAMGAFRVNRQGRALPAVREALRRLARGEAVGLFPEGEIVRAAASVVHGGTIRRGVALLAARSGRPVIPVVVAGTHRLSAPGPWLPARRGRLWIMAGEPLLAPAGAHTRAGRAAFAAELERTFVSLYAGLRQEFSLPADAIP